MQALQGSVIQRNDVTDPSTSKVDLNAAISIPITVRVSANPVGSGVLASITDINGTPVSNPTTTDNNGNYLVYVTDGSYDVIANEGLTNETVEAGVIAGVDLTQDLSQSYEFNTLSDATSSGIPFPFGKVLDIKERKTGEGGGSKWYVTDSTTVTSDGYGVVVFDATRSLVISDIAENKNTFNISAWGCERDTNSSLPFQAIIDHIESNASYDEDFSKTGYSSTVYVPSGRFELTGVTISKFGISIVGDNPEGSILYNTNTSDRMLSVAYDSGNNTIGGCNLENIQIRNTVSRADNSTELVLLDKLVRSHISNVHFISSPFTNSSRQATKCDMLKMVSPFEVSLPNCFFWGSIGIALDIISAFQSDSFDLMNTVFLYNTISCVGFRGAGGSGGNVLKWSGKMLGTQGGSYVAGSQDAFAKTVVTSSTATTLTVSDSTNMQANRAVVFGTGADGTVNNDMNIAIIKSINGNILTLDRTFSTVASATVFSGRIGFIGSEMRQPEIEGAQFEGLDIGFLSTTGCRYLNAHNMTIGNCAKGFYFSNQFRNFNLGFYTAAANGTLQNGVDFKLITVDDNIVTYANNIVLETNGIEGSGYSTGPYSSAVDVVGSYEPFISVIARTSGVSYVGNNGRSAVEFQDRSYLTFNRSSTATFCRAIFQDNGVDKYYINFTNANGDITIQQAGNPKNSIFLSGFNGNVLLGGGWDEPHLVIGDIHFWVDSNDAYRGQKGAPISEFVGSVIQQF